MNWVWLGIIVVGLMILPFVIEKIIVEGIGIVLFTTQFGNETWFSFWGSYLGAVITVIVLWITIRYNKRDTENRIKEYEIDRKYDLVLEYVDKLYNFVLLKGIDNDKNVYEIRLDAKMYQLIFQKCLDETEACRFYLLYQETILKYLEKTKQFDNIKLTNENIADYAEKYKTVSKELTKVMHSVKSELDVEYTNLKEFIEKKRREEKKQLYKSKSIKDFFKNMKRKND